MTNILHLSSTFMSGYPTRLSELINKHSQKYRSRCITAAVDGTRRPLDVDLKSFEMAQREIEDRVGWADIIHYHGLHSIGFLESHGIGTPKGKDQILQIYEHPEEELYRYEDPNHAVPAGVACIITPRCSFVRWPSASFLAMEVPHSYEEKVYAPRAFPNVSVDIKHLPHVLSYREIYRPLKEMEQKKEIMLHPIDNKDHYFSVVLKSGADIGVGDILEGRYNLSALDYAAAGVPCFCKIGAQTRANIEKLTKASTLPWLNTDKDRFMYGMNRIVERKLWSIQGKQAKEWIDAYWNPSIILKHYTEAYDCL